MKTKRTNAGENESQGSTTVIATLENNLEKLQALVAFSVSIKRRDEKAAVEHDIIISRAVSLLSELEELLKKMAGQVDRKL